MHPDDADNDSEQRRRLLAGEIPAFRVEKRYFDAAGETASTILSMSLVRDHDGTPLHYIAQLQDVSERRRLEENMRGLGDHDPLTGLRNRRLFGHDLKLQVARSRRYGEVAGLMVIDVDAFRRVNDIHGEQAGDQALEAIARALTRRLRETDLSRASGPTSSRCCCRTSTRRGSRSSPRGSPTWWRRAAWTSVTRCCTPARASASRSWTSTSTAPSRRCGPPTACARPSAAPGRAPRAQSRAGDPSGAVNTLNHAAR